MTQTSAARKARLAEIEAKLQEHVSLLNTAQCKKSLAQFTKEAWHIIEPETKLLWNWHMDTICGYLEAAYERKITRLIINVPPGSLKSILVSVMFPAWVWIQDPSQKFLGVSNIQDLAIRDATKTKRIITDEWYQKQWPLALQADQSAKTNYENQKTGFRISLGMTGNITGKRGDIVLIDDPHDAESAQSDVKRTGDIRTYDGKLSTRVNHQATSVFIVIMQRLHHMDLTGHLLSKTKRKWVHICIPMEYEAELTYDAGKDIGRPELNDPRTEEGELLFPALFPADSVESLKEDLGEYGTAGQLQQRPSVKGGGILKQHWFRIWPDDVQFPICDHIWVSWDTAYSEKDLENNSYSACTQWGLFWNPDQQRDCLILLDVWYDQVDYPTLRNMAKRIDDVKQPDCHLIEKKASGQSLIQDLRQARIRVKAYNPDKDKVTRAYSIQAMLESGQVYVPDRKWARHFTYLASTFPTGVSESNDLVDTFTQACLYVKNRWYVTHPKDDENEPVQKKAKARRAYGAL